jgi:Rrf2 family protein
VKLSIKSDYAARAVLALARARGRRRSRKAEELATEQGIPANYLVQILIELKTRGLVRSHRGKEGGYSLAKPPAEITLGEVLRAIHGHVFDPPALREPHCPPELRDAWQRLKADVEAAADAINFQQLLEDAERRSSMYYI